jgi:hypothetical protein
MDAEPNEKLPKSAKVLKRIESPLLQPLVVLDLFDKLEVEGLQRLAEGRDLVSAVALAAPISGIPIEPRLLFGDALDASWYSVSLRIMSSLPVRLV